MKGIKRETLHFRIKWRKPAMYSTVLYLLENEIKAQRHINSLNKTRHSDKTIKLRSHKIIVGNSISAFVALANLRYINVLNNNNNNNRRASTQWQRRTWHVPLMQTLLGARLHGVPSTTRSESLRYILSPSPPSDTQYSAHRSDTVHSTSLL